MKNVSPDGVNQLTAKGYTKAVARQALADAGGNVSQALRALKLRDNNSSSTTAKPQTMQPTFTPPGKAYIPSIERHSRSVWDDEPSMTFKYKTGLSKKRHPCLAQGKECRGGESCRLKNLPGDACIYYALYDACDFGDACLYRHISTDLYAGDEAAQERGSALAEILHPCLAQGKECRGGESCRLKNLPGDACIYYALYDACNFGDACLYRHISLDGNTGEEAVQLDTSHGGSTERHDFLLHEELPVTRNNARSHDAASYWAVCSADDFSPSANATVAGTALLDAREEVPFPAHATAPSDTTKKAFHPAPFLNALQRGKFRGVSQMEPPKVTRVPHFCVADSSPPASTSPPKKRHPCIAQFGSCKFSNNCIHADRDADVCALFLQDRCFSTSDTCKYRHESQEEYHAKIQQRAGLSTTAAATAKDSCSAPASPPRTLAKSKCRLQGFGDGLPATSDKPSASSSFPTMETATRQPLQSGRIETATSSLTPPPPTAAASWSSSTTPATSLDLIDTSELSVFHSLLEAFPSLDATVVLLALRAADGDPMEATSIIARWEETTDGEHDALLTAVSSEEAAEASAEEVVAKQMEARTESLLTLCHIFHTLEPSAIEAVLSQNNGDLALTCELLRCSSEHLTKSNFSNYWKSNNSPAEELTLKRLQTMFPNIPSDVVCCTFGASGKQLSASVQELNKLTASLFSMEALAVRDHRTRRRCRPARVPTLPPPPLSTTTTATTFTTTAPLPSATPDVDSSDEVRRLYLDAEKEILSFGDWRRVRSKAYNCNTCGIRTLMQAVAAFNRGDGEKAKLLSRRGNELITEYHRLNGLAKLALEQERLQKDRTSTLDLHGFHADEIRGVVMRRMALCVRRNIQYLKIVVGEGKHSKSEQRPLYAALEELLRTDPYLLQIVKNKKVESAYIKIRLNLPEREY